MIPALQKSAFVCFFTVINFMMLGLPAICLERYNISYIYKLKPKVTGMVMKTAIRIPIPSDCNGQKIVRFNLFSKPKEIKYAERVDQYGQKVAIFRISKLASGQEVTVGYKCICEFKPVKIPLDPKKAKTISAIPKNLQSLYTQNIRGVYDLDNSDIKSVSRQFRTQYPNLVERVKAIHNYVASLLKYDRDKKWKSAAYVIRTRKGSCSEFCFLFSALCRANGIPTRFVGTSRLRTTKRFPYKDKVWHRFVEVYIPPYGWVPFDPTRDRGNPPKQNFAGSYELRSLVVMRGGGNSSILGKTNYIGSNNNSKRLSRSRVFIWNKVQ